MARLPRLAVAGLPTHIIQRGHNGQPVFVDTADRLFFLERLGQISRDCRVAVHAYVLMDDHYHLLVTPDDAPGLSRMMQSLGRAYVRYFNDRHGRRGTLWDGRFRSAVLQAERYVLACMVLLDLNPVRTGAVERAADYAWSSHGHYAGIRHDPLITPVAAYWGLGNTPFAREAAYGQQVAQGLDEPLRLALADSALRGWALGDAEFVAQTQKKTARRIAPGRAGRPAKAPIS